MALETPEKRMADVDEANSVGACMARSARVGLDWDHQMRVRRKRRRLYKDGRE